MEKAGLRESVLPALHPNQRHQLWNQLHLQSPQDKAGSCKSELEQFYSFPARSMYLMQVLIVCLFLLFYRGGFLNAPTVAAEDVPVKCGFLLLVFVYF